MPTENIQKNSPKELLLLPTNDTDNADLLSDDLQEKIVGKWKTKFYAWDRYGREDWDPMVLDNQTVIISMDKVDYLDYLIEKPQFYCKDWSIDEQSTFHQFPSAITKFQKDIIDITISAKDNSLYPAYYAIGFIIIDDILFLNYQGAYFEITKLDE